ncbi:MAG: hypothetical protein AUK48_13495 [Oscillatoriales cyanobacterium CG2_30_44_21]|nr:MAG: hypothetical protein AUK48_13495 [Oscillatoriales cyanobacterium CG2_30_44_21]
MRKFTFSTITLATLLCITSNNYFLVSSAYAASKSAISPDVLVIQNTDPIQPAPEIAPPPTLPIANDREPIQVNIESADTVFKSPAPDESNPERSPIVEAPEVILENRANGCKFSASSLLERDQNFCNPQVASKSAPSRQGESYQEDSGVLYAAASETTSLQVRRLSAKEIAAISLPSNGDKQMLFPLIVPTIISSLFGDRVHPITGQVRFHQGTDLAAPEGTPVVAAFSGTVEIAGWAGGYGLMVSITHGDTHETRYAHLSEVLVESGQKVKQGTVIGLVGSTGMSTGAHLHFEIWQRLKDGMVAIDPTSQLVLAMDNLQKYLAQISKSSNKA